MRAFRASGAHLKAMPRLLRWCDEASIAHRTTADTALPSMDEAFELMRQSGRLSKVHHPSERQTRGETVGERPPKVGMRLSPAKRVGT